MALLKAFVCQVVLFGLYKLFLEEVVEAHLVPDELTRNCIVGFVCLVCFGIQLYTDKPDEDYAEADENPKSESRGATSTKKFEPSEIPATHEKVGSNESSRATAYSGIFAQYSPNMSDGIKANGTGKPDVPASPVRTSYNQEVTNPVLNGFSETNVCEESDDDGIEIDQFVAKKSDKEKLEQFETFRDDGPIKSEYVTEEAKHLRVEVQVIKPEDVTEEAKQTTSDEPKVVEPIKGEEATEEAKQITSDEPEVVEPIKGEDVTEEAKQITSDEPEVVESIKGEEKAGEAEQLKSIEAEDVIVIKSEDVMEEVNQSRTDEVEAIKPEKVTEADVESKCLIANGEAEEVKTRATEPEEVEPIKGEVTEPELATVEAEDVVIKSEDVEEVSQSRTNEEAIKPEEVTETVVESKCLIANGKAEEVFNPQGVTEEVKQSTAIEDEIKATQSSEVEEAVVESECLSANGDDNLPTPDSDTNTNLKIGESSEVQMTNGIDESLNNIDGMSSNIIEEKSTTSIKDDGEIGNGQETTLSSQPDEYTNDIKESLPSPQEISNTISISTKVANDLETDNKNEETTTLVLTAVSPPSEKLTASTRQKATVAADVCVAPITIDISFIYACH